MPILQQTLARSGAFTITYILAAYFCGSVFGESLVLTPPLEVGEAIDLEMSVIRERTIAGRQPMKATVNAPVRVEVLAVAEAETVIGWTTGKGKITDGRFDERMAKALEDLSAGQTVELVFDDEFTPRSIRNLDQLMPLLQKTIDVLEQSLPKDKAAAAVIPRLREQFANKEFVQSVMIQKPGRYFLIYGWELEPGIPRDVEVTMPNPFSGEPLPASVKIELRPFQPSDEHHVIVYHQQLDQQGVQRILREATRRFAADRLPAEESLPKLNIVDHGEFKVNRETGWVEHAVIKRTSTSPPQEGSQVESIEFKLVK